MKRRPLVPGFVALTTAALLAVSPRAGWAADDLATARDLYASAAYEEALTTLNRVRAAGVAASDMFAVEQYRAFCLLALGRGTEAQSAIESLVVANPLYQPSSEVSPRVRTAFSDVRRRLLPTIIPQKYANATAAFHNMFFAAAAAGFADVINALDDPDVSQAAAQPPLSDVRTLALGFKELSAKAAEPPPAPEPPPPPAPVAPPTPVAPQPARVYNAGEENVVPPEAIRQEMPTFVGRPIGAPVGALEIIINEKGQVESATIRRSMNASYDRQVVDAARMWRYRPATVNGNAVKFRKLIQIAVKPT
jgi:protein TonB